MEVTSVESLCNLLARSRLLAAADVRNLRQRWLREGGKSVGNVTAFVRWLIANQYATEYQTNLLLRGKIERFFLSEYKLLDRIGKGRMAGVYKAIHRLGQIVAIKVLPPSKVKDPQIFGRFQREARLAVPLKHPHIVRTIQTGEDIGLHYIVMEFLEGQTLEDLLAQRRKLSGADALPLLLQALYGLQYLHEHDIVHRDLNPGNLMLLPTFDAAGRSTLSLKILDIGLGRALFDEGIRGADAQELTTEGALLGEPDYMAPEQARDAHAADIRADIYSLGCVLYHMLTGQVPFPDSSRIRKLVRHSTETPRPLAEFNPQSPEGVQQLLNALLAKDPAQRFPTPEVAAKAVLGLLNTMNATASVAAVAPPAKAATVPTVPLMPPVPMAMPVPPPTKPPPLAAPVAAPPISELVFDPIANMPTMQKPRTWKETLQIGRRDLIVFGLGLFAGLFAIGIALLLVSLFVPRIPPPTTKPDATVSSS